MDAYSNLISNIIKEQEAIIGPIAIDQARRVRGLKLTNINDVAIEGNGKEILTNLVRQYETLFGKASIEVCKDAVKEVKPPVSPDELPDILK